MRNCINCAAPLQEGDLFCSACGTRQPEQGQGMDAAVPPQVLPASGFVQEEYPARTVYSGSGTPNNAPPAWQQPGHPPQGAPAPDGAAWQQGPLPNNGQGVTPQPQAPVPPNQPQAHSTAEPPVYTAPAYTNAPPPYDPAAAQRQAVRQQVPYEQSGTAYTPPPVGSAAQGQQPPVPGGTQVWQAPPAMGGQVQPGGPVLPPPVGGGPGGNGGKKKPPVGLIVGIAAAAVVLLAAVIIGLSFIVSGNASGSATPSRVDEPAFSSRSQRPGGSSAPASSSVPDPVANWSWVIEPSLNYDSMWPLASSAPYGAVKYLNVMKDGKVGTVQFDDAGVIFDLYSGQAPFFCDMGMVHGLPPEIEDMAEQGEDAQARAMMDKGFPFRTHGGHGYGDPLVWGYNPADGSMTLGFYGYGMFYYQDEWLAGVEVPEVLEVINLANMDEYGEVGDTLFGLADADGNLLLPLEYDYVSNLFYASERMLLLCKGNKWGYYNLDTRTLTADAVFDAPWQTEYGGEQPGYFWNGLCPVKQNGKVGYIDTQGNWVIEPIFEGATHVVKGQAWVKQDGLWGKISIER